MVDDDEGIVIASPPKMRAGMVTFRIKHTARTWGADIEALLSGHLENILQTQSPVRKFVWRHSGGIAFTVGAAFFAAAVAVSFLMGARIRHLQQGEVTQLLEQRALVEQKIDFMLASVASGVWATYFFSVIVFLLVSLFVSLLLGAWVGSMADTDQPSFVVLTREAEKQRELILKRYERRWALFILSLIVTLCTGIFANVIFQAFWR
jgi:hypothetical protein